MLVYQGAGSPALMTQGDADAPFQIAPFVRRRDQLAGDDETNFVLSCDELFFVL